MSQIQAFCFESTAVRILGTSENPLFVAKDVLEAIGASTTVSAVREMVVEGLGEEFVTNKHLDTPGGRQEMLLLSESALTLFISRSRTELGKRLNRWIHVEVLPKIRKTGSYSVHSDDPKLLTESGKVELDC